MKRVRHDWQISARDLPHEEIVKDEPYLRDLENNAVYRMMHFRRARQQALFGSRPTTYLILGLALLMVIILPGILPFVGLLLVIMAVVFSRPTWREPDASYLLGLDRGRVADLHFAGVKEEAIIVAVWGIMIRGARPGKTPPLMFTIAITFVVALGALSDWSLLWIAVPIGFIAGIANGRWRYLPYNYLPNVLKTLENAALRTRGARANVAEGCGTVFIYFWIIMLLGWGIIIGMALLTALSEKFVPVPMTFLLHPIFISVVVVIAYLIGIYFGKRQGWILRDECEWWISRMRPHVKELLERSRDEADQL